jgi:hypothetical protein
LKVGESVGIPPPPILAIAFDRFFIKSSGELIVVILGPKVHLSILASKSPELEYVMKK